jgi:hypothetical protein
MNRKLKLAVKTIAVKSFALLMMIGMTNSAAFSQTRIRFARGRTSTTVAGSLSSGSERAYILRASAGQTMTVRVSSRSGNVSVDLGGNDVGTGTSVELRSTDEYIITVHNDGGATSYSLYVAIR